jgi:hypothetical protein
MAAGRIEAATMLQDVGGWNSTLEIEVWAS